MLSKSPESVVIMRQRIHSFLPFLMRNRQSVDSVTFSALMCRKNKHKCLWSDVVSRSLPPCCYIKCFCLSLCFFVSLSPSPTLQSLVVSQTFGILHPLSKIPRRKIQKESCLLACNLPCLKAHIQYCLHTTSPCDPPSSLSLTHTHTHA